MKDEIKEITKVDKQLLDKIEHILASELSCKEYDEFYNYFNEIRKPNILIDIKDDENIKDYITNLQEEYEKEHYLVDKLTRQLNDEYKNTEYQCKQKENIIKEVRKIFKYYGNKEDIVGYANYTITGESLLELLEILDKENNNETI